MKWLTVTLMLTIVWIPIAAAERTANRQFATEMALDQLNIFALCSELFRLPNFSDSDPNYAVAARGFENLAFGISIGIGESEAKSAFLLAQAFSIAKEQVHLWVSEDQYPERALMICGMLNGIIDIER